MLSTNTQDLESGTTAALPIDGESGILEAVRRRVGPTIQSGAETQIRSREADCTHEHRRLFDVEDGQALLLAFGARKNDMKLAVSIPVYRPSGKWGRKMEELETQRMDLPVAVPESTQWEGGRWREFRWQYPGESEADVWRQIRQCCKTHRPWLYSALPFWRPSVEEREVGVVPAIARHES